MNAPAKYNIILMLLAAFSLCLFHCKAGAADEKSLIKLRTVVIDPGHGGSDPGCINRAKGLKEKDITLSVALKLGALIKQNYPEVKVLYTRSTDKAVDLRDRTDIANRNKADLFISIHVNSAADASAKGVETWVMGTNKTAANMEVCKTENSAIILENDYTSKYQGFDPESPESYIIFSLIQNTHLEQSLYFAGLVQNQLVQGPIVRNRGVKQGPFLVLWTATMPTILIELGFISNDNDSRLLANRYNHNTFAKRIFAAFKEYKTKYESESIRLADGTESQASRTGESFGIQIFSRTSPANNKRLMKGLDAYCIRDGKYYKYIYGNFDTRDGAMAELETVRKKFKDAFIVKMENGSLVKKQTP